MREHSKTTLVLSRTDIEGIINRTGVDRLMDLMIDQLDKAIQDHDPAKTEIPARSGFNYTEPNTGLVEWMPLYKQGKEVLIKVVGYHPSNPKDLGLPTIISSLYAYDTTTGHLTGVVDGVLITALRTGAASAVASKYLAHPDSTVLGLIGCGTQSVTQLHAISRIFNIRTVLINDIDDEAQDSFADRIEVLGLDVELRKCTIDEVVSGSDILCTATSIEVDQGPLFDDVPVRAHLHINAVGSDFPGKTEVPVSMLKGGFVCPDFIEQAMVEGECQRLDPDDVGPSITHVVKNHSKYQMVSEALSIFDSTGWALEDMVAMDLFLELGAQYGLGQEIEIENLAGDAKNPYSFIPKPVMSVSRG